MRRVGKLTLNRNPDNFFAETEQVAFHTGHVVPGIDFTNDPLLQGRLFSYLDTQLRRGGPNFAELPINRPLGPVHNNQRDAMARHDDQQGPGRILPEPPRRRLPDALARRGRCASSATPRRSSGDKIRERSESFADHFSQATHVLEQHVRLGEGAHRCGFRFRTQPGRKRGRPVRT